MNHWSRSIPAALGALLTAAVWVARPSAADPAVGAYTGTMVDAGSSDLQEGSTAPFTVTPCGADCLHVVQTGTGWDLYRQGPLWVGSKNGGTVTLDENSLVFSVRSPTGNAVVIQLAKNA
jgi:hypothetical protein